MLWNFHLRCYLNLNDEKGHWNCTWLLFRIFRVINKPPNPFSNKKTCIPTVDLQLLWSGRPSAGESIDLRLIFSEFSEQFSLDPSISNISVSPSYCLFQYKPLFHPKVRKDPISQRQTASKTQCMLYFKDISFFHHKFWTQTFHIISFLFGLVMCQLDIFL